MMRLPAALVLGLVLAASAAAAKAPNPIAASDAWSRPATPGLPGVGYLTLVNHGPTPDRLMGASTPKAGAVSLHRSAMSKGVMTMTALSDGLALPPGAAVRLAPNGYHLMLTGLKGGLKIGERYPLTLRFAHAKPKTVQMEVRSGAETMAGMKMP